MIYDLKHRAEKRMTGKTQENIIFKYDPSPLIIEHLFGVLAEIFNVKIESGLFS